MNAELHNSPEEQTLLAWHSISPQVGLPVLAVIDEAVTDQMLVWLHAQHTQLCRLKALRALGCHQEAQTLAAHLDLEDQAEQWAQSYSL
jgi:hypothetical protein